MLKLKYSSEKTNYAVEFKKITAHIIQITGDFPVKEKGFSLFRAENEEDAWDYSSYKTLYREIKGGAQFSDDGSIYDPAVEVVFQPGTGGKLEGDTSQHVDDYADLSVPSPVPEENYKFTGWNPEVPKSGKIDKNITFYAVFTYEPTEEEKAAEFEQRKKARIAESKLLLEEYLEGHPITSTAHGDREGVYSVTNDKQDLMTRQYMTYQIEKAIDPSSAKLRWNESGKSCQDWQEDEFLQLVLEIKAYVYPYVSYQQMIEEEVAVCTTQEELDAVVIDYESVRSVE